MLGRSVVQRSTLPNLNFVAAYHDALPHFFLLDELLKDTAIWLVAIVCNYDDVFVSAAVVLHHGKEILVNAWLWDWHSRERVLLVVPYSLTVEAWVGDEEAVTPFASSVCKLLLLKSVSHSATPIGRTPRRM